MLCQTIVVLQVHSDPLLISEVFHFSLVRIRLFAVSFGRVLLLTNQGNELACSIWNLGLLGGLVDFAAGCRGTKGGVLAAWRKNYIVLTRAIFLVFFSRGLNKSQLWIVLLLRALILYFRNLWGKLLGKRKPLLVRDAPTFLVRT